MMCCAKLSKNTCTVPNTPMPVGQAVLSATTGINGAQMSLNLILRWCHCRIICFFHSDFKSMFGESQLFKRILQEYWWISEHTELLGDSVNMLPLNEMDILQE